MRYAIIEENKVVNIIEATGQLGDLNMILDDGTAQIGGTWDGANFINPDANAELTKAIAEAIAGTYADVDAVYRDAVGQRGPEYSDAEADARAFIAGAAVTPYVSDFALHNPTGKVQSNEWAVGQIIGRADAFRGAKLAMRSKRFASQEEMRAATTTTELDLAVAKWTGFIAGLRTQLGL